MTGPRIGKHDEFEGIYKEKFRSLARPYGEFVEYERDRAAIDVGLHLTEVADDKVREKFKNVSKTVTHTRVWFQLKGLHESTLSLEEFNESSDVPLSLELNQLRFWYASPEAVYLAVYVECADVFLVEDIRDVIDRHWGESIFSAETFREGQETATVRVLKSAQLDDDLWYRMLGHRSMRIDGPSWRGRLLGHRLDPLRSSLNQMDPAAFEQLVNRLLSVHRYELTDHLDPARLFPEYDLRGDKATLSYGTLYYTYEFVLQMTTEFGYDHVSIEGVIEDDYRIEGDIISAQGPCAVLIHSDKVSYPDMDAVKALAQELVDTKGIRRLLVFTNDKPEPAYFGSFFGAVHDTGLRCEPQFLGDLAFNVLVAITVYLEFRDRLSWEHVSYLY